MLKVFISGPISGLPIEVAKARFAEAENMLQLANYQPVNPFKLNTSAYKSWEENMKVCIGALLDCDRIFMISGWPKSKGASLERDLAESLGIPRLFLLDLPSSLFS